MTAGDDSSLLADLPLQARAALAEKTIPPTDTTALLAAIQEGGPTHALDLGVVAVRSDTRWFANTSAEIGGGEPIVVLRRWPGDTVLALYALAPNAGGRPPVPGAAWAGEPRAGLPAARWQGTLATDGGDRPVLWLERSVGELPSRLGALVIPGDAGLGPAATESLVDEALFLFSRVEVKEAAWRIEPALEAGALVRVPAAGAPPGARSEDTDPWQVALGPGFSLGLPPGFRAIRLDVGVAPPIEVPGAVLWIRGRCRDSQGDTVAVGDAVRYGYVARVDAPTKEWASGMTPPRGAPSAKLAIEPAVSRQLAEATEATTASAGRWREAGFDGDWLVFRLRFAEHGVEIGLPVLSGRRSPSLFWIAQSWRAEGRSPAAPPVDPAERFGIRFARLTTAGRRDAPWVEGYLTIPGLRADVSRDLYPAASLRSERGFPVRFAHRSGRPVGTLERLEAAEARTWIDAHPGCAELDKPSRHGARRSLSTPAGDRFFLAPEGHAFLFVPDPTLQDAELTDLRELWTLMLGSVHLGPS